MNEHFQRLVEMFGLPIVITLLIILMIVLGFIASDVMAGLDGLFDEDDDENYLE